MPLYASTSAVPILVLYIVNEATWILKKIDKIKKLFIF